MNSQDYNNIEGKIQKAYCASFPPGEAKEDWKIFNELSKIISGKLLFQSKEELINNMFNFLKLNNKNENNKNENLPQFKDETFDVDEIDYYFSNVVARSSLTMAKCRAEKKNIKRTGTEG